MNGLNQRLPEKPLPIGKIRAGRDSAGIDGLHPAWIAFIDHCRELGFGDIAQLKIQDGLPVMAEKITTKVKFI